MRPPVTNFQRRARDAFQLAFAPEGAAKLVNEHSGKRLSRVPHACWSKHCCPSCESCRRASSALKPRSPSSRPDNPITSSLTTCRAQGPRLLRACWSPSARIATVSPSRPLGKPTSTLSRFWLSGVVAVPLMKGGSGRIQEPVAWLSWMVWLVVVFGCGGRSVGEKGSDATAGSTGVAGAAGNCFGPGRDVGLAMPAVNKGCACDPQRDLSQCLPDGSPTMYVCADKNVWVLEADAPCP